MAKLSHDQIADKDVLKPLKDEFRELNELAEETTQTIIGLKKVFSETKEIKSSKDVKNLTDATAELNRKEKILIQAKKDIVRVQKKAVSALTAEEKAENKLTEAKKQNIAVRRKSIKSIAEQRVKTQELNKQTKMLARQTLGLIKPHERLTRTTDKAQKEFKDLAVQYGLTSKQALNAEKRFRKLDNQLRKVNNSARDGRRDVGRYGIGLKGLKGNLLRGIGPALGFAAGLAGIVAVILSSIGIFAKLAKANSNLQAVLGATENQMISLKEAQVDLGATTANTAQEYAELQTELAKLGFPTSDILDMTAAIQAGGQAMQADLGANAKLTGAIMRIFGKEAGSAADINDVLSASTSKSALDFERLSSSMSTIGPVAKAFGFSLKGTVSLLGGLADAGFDASSAATATRNIMLKLADSSSELAKRLKEPVKDLPSLIKGLKQLKEEGVDLGEALELTDRRSVAAFNTFLNGTDSVLALNDALNASVGTAQRMAETQLDNLIGDITILNSAWEGFILSVESGDGAFNKTLRSIIKGTTKFIGSLTKQSTAVDKNIKSLEKEKIALFELSSQILDTNTNTQTRNQLLEEMDRLYPSVLANLSKEERSYDNLKEAMTRANTQLNTRIQIQKALIGVDTIAQKIAEKRAQVDAINVGIQREVVDLFESQGRLSELLGLGSEERIALAQKEFTFTLNLNAALRQRDRVIQKIANQQKILNKETIISNAVIAGILTGTTKLNDLSTAELRTLVERGHLTDKKLRDEAKYIIILRERNREQKEANDLDVKAVKIVGESDLIKLKQAEIKTRKEVAATTIAELALKNEELRNLGLQLKILQEVGIEKDKEAKRQKEEIERLRILQQLRQAELRGLIELNERLLDSEELTAEQRLDVVDELFRLKKEVIEEAAAFELENEEITAEERELIAVELQNELAALEGERVNAVQDANDAILALEKEANDKRAAQNRAFFESIKNNALKSIDEQNKAVNDRLNADVKSREEAVRLQQQRAGNGLENSLAEQEALLDKARLKRDIELEAQRKKEKRLALQIAFLNQFQALSNQDPDTAAFKAFQNTFLANSLSDIFLGFEKGGLVDGPEQLIKINEKGKEFVIDAPTTKAYGLDKRGSSMDNLHKLMSGSGTKDLTESIQDYYDGNKWAFMQNISNDTTLDSESIVKAVNAGNEKVAIAVKKHAAKFNVDVTGIMEMMVTVGEGATLKATKYIIDNFDINPRR